MEPRFLPSHSASQAALVHQAPINNTAVRWCLHIYGFIDSHTIVPFHLRGEMGGGGEEEAGEGFKGGGLKTVDWYSDHRPARFRPAGGSVCIWSGVSSHRYMKCAKRSNERNTKRRHMDGRPSHANALCATCLLTFEMSAHFFL